MSQYPLNQEVAQDREQLIHSQVIWQPAVVIGGSVRSPEVSRWGALAMRLGEEVQRRALPIRTGGGPGLVEVPLMGYVRARSLGNGSQSHSTQGLRIRINITQQDSKWVESMLWCHQFGPRKQGLCCNALGQIVLPGGTGTIDEALEAEMSGVAVAYLGRQFWEPILEQFSSLRPSALEHSRPGSTIITDSITMALDHIQSMYSPLRIEKDAMVRANVELRGGLSRIVARPTPVSVICGEVSGDAKQAIGSASKVCARNGWRLRVAICGADDYHSIPVDGGEPNETIVLVRRNQFHSADHCATNVLFVCDKYNFGLLATENSRGIVFLPDNERVVSIALETITAIRTKKIRPRPLIFVDGGFWRPLFERISNAIEGTGVDWLPKEVNALISVVDYTTSLMSALHCAPNTQGFPKAILL